MCQVTAGLGFGAHLLQHRLRRKRLQQFVMTRARLVHARHERVDDRQPRLGSEPQRGEAGARSNVTLAVARRLEGAHDGRPDGDDAAASGAGLGYEYGRRRRDLVWFVERQTSIEVGIAGR